MSPAYSAEPLSYRLGYHESQLPWLLNQSCGPGDGRLYVPSAFLHPVRSHWRFVLNWTASGSARHHCFCALACTALSALTALTLPQQCRVRPCVVQGGAGVSVCQCLAASASPFHSASDRPLPRHIAALDQQSRLMTAQRISAAVTSPACVCPYRPRLSSRHPLLARPSPALEWHSTIAHRSGLAFRVRV